MGWDCPKSLWRLGFALVLVYAALGIAAHPLKDVIAKETDFNGTKILDVNAETTTKIQVGSQDNQTIDIKISDQSGWNKYNDSGSVPSAAVNGEMRTVAALGFDVLSSSPASLTLGTNTDSVADIAADASTSANTFATASLVSYSDTSGKTSYAVIDTNASATGEAVAVSFDSDGKAVIGEKLTGANKFLAEDSDNYTVLTDGGTVSTSGESNALATLDSALKAVDEQRSQLGAIQNRFDSAITNLSTTTTNLSAARSRIEDADYATEVSNMTRAQILQQAGTSVLAQANQVPQGVLSLLQ